MLTCGESCAMQICWCLFILEFFTGAKSPVLMESSQHSPKRGCIAGLRCQAEPRADTLL